MPPDLMVKEEDADRVFDALVQEESVTSTID